MIDDDQTVILCAVGAPDADSIPGSIATTCAECGQTISLAPSGQQIKRERNAETICVPCGLTQMVLDRKSKFAPLTDEQKRELAEAGLLHSS